MKILNLSSQENMSAGGRLYRIEMATIDVRINVYAVKYDTCSEWIIDAGGKRSTYSAKEWDSIIHAEMVRLAKELLSAALAELS